MKKYLFSLILFFVPLFSFAFHVPTVDLTSIYLNGNKIRVAAPCVFNGNGRLFFSVDHYGTSTQYLFDSNPNFQCSGLPYDFDFTSYSYAPQVGDLFQVGGDTNVYSQLFQWNGSQLINFGSVGSPSVSITFPANNFVATTSPFVVSTSYTSNSVSSLLWIHYYDMFSTSTDFVFSVPVTSLTSATHDFYVTVPYPSTWIVSVYLSDLAVVPYASSLPIAVLSTVSVQNPFSSSTIQTLLTSSSSISGLDFSVSSTTCSQFDLMCDFTNSMAYLFVPSTTSVTNLLQYVQYQSNIPPFSWYRDMFNIVKNATVSGGSGYSVTASTTLGVIPVFTFGATSFQSYLGQGVIDTLGTLCDIGITLMCLIELIATLWVAIAYIQGGYH